MRNYEIEQILSRWLPSLTVQPKTAGTGKLSLAGLDRLREARDPLATIAALEPYVRALDSLGVLSGTSEMVTVDPATAKKFQDALADLRITAEALLTAVRGGRPPSDETAVAMRLPDFQTFDDLAAILGDLKKAITLPISEPGINGQVQITGVENGSVWFYVALGVPAAVTLVATLAWSAAVVYKKVQEGLAYREYVKNLKLKNEHEKAIIDAEKAHLALLVNEEADKVAKEYFGEAPADPERVERLKLSIKTMAEMMGRGFEIHPSITAPENVSNLFPDFRTLRLPTIEKQQIGDGADEPEP